MSKLYEQARADAEQSALYLKQSIGIILSPYELTVHASGYCNGYRAAMRELLDKSRTKEEKEIINDLIKKLVK